MTLQLNYGTKEEPKKVPTSTSTAPKATDTTTQTSQTTTSPTASPPPTGGTTTQTATPPTSSGSPVTATGKIAPSSATDQIAGGPMPNLMDPTQQLGYGMTREEFAAAYPQQAAMMFGVNDRRQGGMDPVGGEGFTQLNPPPPPAFQAPEPTQENWSNPIPYWEGLLNNPNLSPQQRQLVQDYIRQERTFAQTNPERVGLTLRNLGTFNNSGAQPTPGTEPPPAGPPMSPYGTYPGAPEGISYTAGQLPTYDLDPYQQQQIGHYGVSPYQQFQYSQGGFNPYQAERYGQPPPEAYQAGNITQYGGAPDYGGVESSQRDLLQQILANPSMSAENVAQLKAANLEESTLMQKQIMDQLGQSAAQRGVTGGGWQQGEQRLAGNEAIDRVLSGNRSIDIEKMQRDRADQLNALGMSDQILTGQQGRSSQAYATGLSGQEAQERANQAAAESRAESARLGLSAYEAEQRAQQAAADSRRDSARLAFDQQSAQAGEGQYADKAARDDRDYSTQIDRYRADEYSRAFDQNRQRINDIIAREGQQQQLNQAEADSKLAAYQTELDAYFQSGDLARLNRALDIQLQLGLAGINVDQRRIDESARQFDLGLGFDYAQLNATQQNQLINQILGLM